VKRLVATLAMMVGSILLLGAVLFAHLFFSRAQYPATVELRIEQGESFASVVRKLRENRVIPNERIFSLWARISGAAKKVQWGVYRFEMPLSPHEVLKQIVSGKVILHRVTIPEGLTFKEIADLLAKSAMVDKARFLAEASNPELLKSLGVRATSIEGYLFPNTYQFAPATPEREIIVTMTEQFRKVFEPLISAHHHRIDLTPHEILTLASMIEKETGIEAERPLVSAVFHNRLKRNMPLQSDPTVIYGLKDFNGNLTRKDLLNPSPYNTYRIPSLPPGPICNPGLSSIKAALQPAAVPYLYFVSKNDGTHLFSDTLEAHSRAVKVYQSKPEPLAPKADGRAR
jgi:UPF0755 protein